MKSLNLFGVFILGAALLSAGCHRKPKSISPIPDNMQPPANSNGGVSTSGQVPESTSPSSNTDGTIPQNASKWDQVFNSGNLDREKFKADTVYFDFDRATVKASEETKLQDVANYFKSNSTDALIVEGNCDERGTEKYNLSLGERRALAIREYLANLGVDPQRIKTVTNGALKPVDPGHNEGGWSKNRRGDLILASPK